jgi:hypothetical protein
VSGSISTCPKRGLSMASDVIEGYERNCIKED